MLKNDNYTGSRSKKDMYEKLLEDIIRVAPAIHSQLSKQSLGNIVNLLQYRDSVDFKKFRSRLPESMKTGKPFDQKILLVKMTYGGLENFQHTKKSQNKGQMFKDNIK